MSQIEQDITKRLAELEIKLNKLQQIHGDKKLDAICGAGCANRPNICLVFTNPTRSNVSANKKWQGLKAPWLSTKNIWKMFFQLGFIDATLLNEIMERKPSDWDYEFANKIYSMICNNSIYITNLSKATQTDARALKNEVFRKYLNLFKEEVDIIKPKVIITFGNQVSSILLKENVKVSNFRKRHKIIVINKCNYKVFPVYYPVGQSMRNMKKAKEDIEWILQHWIA